MSGMRTVVVDKIASVTQACGLSHELRIAADIPCEEGLVVVVEILNNKSTYNTLELTSGRMAKVARGDVVVGALGHRKALFGYSGHIPRDAQTGRCHSNAEHRRRPRHLRFGDAGQGQTLRLQGAGSRADLPVSRRAHRRARQGRLQGAGLRRRAQRARSAGGGARRHLHGGRQDRGGLRHHRAHAPPRPHRGCVQGHRGLPAPRHPGVRGFRRAAHHDLHRPRHRDHHREMRSRADPDHAHGNGERAA